MQTAAVVWMFISEVALSEMGEGATAGRRYIQFYRRALVVFQPRGRGTL